MHAILVTVGTDGDVFPFAGLEMRLRARGHRVTLLTNEQFRDMATDLNKRFLAMSYRAASTTCKGERQPQTWDLESWNRCN
jgi:rhamnosyltransferase subunit B